MCTVSQFSVKDQLQHIAVWCALDISYNGGCRLARELVHSPDMFGYAPELSSDWSSSEDSKLHFNSLNSPDVSVETLDPLIGLPAQLRASWQN